MSGHLSWQYWRPGSLPQRRALLVCLEADQVRSLCSAHRLLGQVGNRYRLENEELGVRLVECRLRRPFGAIWDSQIATDQL